MKYETTTLALKFRKNLTEHVHEKYLSGTNFYKASNLGGQARIDNADQRVTQDIMVFLSLKSILSITYQRQLFSDALSQLYVTIFKPFLDVVLNTYKYVGFFFHSFSSLRLNFSCFNLQIVLSPWSARSYLPLLLLRFFWHVQTLHYASIWQGM